MVKFFFIFFLVTASLYGQNNGSINFNRVLQTLSSSQIEERPLLADYGTFGSSLLVRNRNNTGINGGTFVFAVPLEAEFAVDTALALAEKLKTYSDSCNIIVAFLYGEKQVEAKFLSPGSIANSGLRDLLTLKDLPENWVLCYFDADEAPVELVLHHGRRGYVAPLDIIKPLPQLFKTHAIPWSFMVNHNNIYKLGLVEGPEPLLIAWEEEVNGFYLSGKSNAASAKSAVTRGAGAGSIDSKRAVSSENISPENLSLLLLEYSGFLRFPVINPDRHYSFFSLSGGRVIFITEEFMAIFLLLIMGFLLLFYLLYSARYNTVLVYHFRLFVKYSWIFFLFLPWLVISLTVSGAIYSSIYRLLNMNVVSANYSGVTLTLLFGTVLFFLPSPALDLVHFPRRARFYGFSALLFGVFGVLSAVFLDFSYMPTFLWAFVFIFIGALVTQPALIFISTSLLPLLAIIGLYNVFETGSSRLSELFIFSQWNSPESLTTSIHLALLSLPILLLFKRGSIQVQKIKHGRNLKKPNRKIRLVILPILLIFIFLAILLQLHLLKKITLQESPFITEISGTENESLKIVALDIDDTVFQDSRIITIQLKAKGEPIRFDISLESGQILFLYSSTVPFEREDSGKKINFYMGEHPPNPLTMEIILPLEFEGLIKTRTVYNYYDPDVLSIEKPDSSDYLLFVSTDAVLMDITEKVTSEILN